jgi:hypothetical protein
VHSHAADACALRRSRGAPFPNFFGYSGLYSFMTQFVIRPSSTLVKCATNLICCFLHRIYQPRMTSSNWNDHVDSSKLTRKKPRRTRVESCVPAATCWPRGSSLRESLSANSEFRTTIATLVCVLQRIDSRESHGLESSAGALPSPARDHRRDARSHTVTREKPGSHCSQRRHIRERWHAMFRAVARTALPRHRSH